jgi:hypothetical protein
VIVRTLLSFVNLAVIAGTVVVWFEFPALAQVALYVLLGWMFVTFVVMYSPWGNRRVTTAANEPGAAAPSPFGAPLPTVGSAPARPAAPLDFCVFCGTAVPVGAPRCPACGHAVVAL